MVAMSIGELECVFVYDYRKPLAMIFVVGRRLYRQVSTGGTD